MSQPLQLQFNISRPKGKDAPGETTPPLPTTPTFPIFAFAINQQVLGDDSLVK